MTQNINVGIVGFGWMGQVHAKAMTRVLQHYPDLGVTPRLRRSRGHGGRRPPGLRPQRVRGVVHDRRLARARRPRATSTWSASPARTSPTVTWPWRPPGPASTSGSRSPRAATSPRPRRSPTRSTRPAWPRPSASTTATRQPSSSPATWSPPGDSGEVRHVRVQMLGDYCAHPDGALTWRFVRELAGSGVIGDLASHGIDLVAVRRRPDRPLAGRDLDVHHRATAGRSARPRTSPAALTALASRWRTRTTCWPCCGSPRVHRGVLEASRASVGEQNSYSFEIHGSTGALAWDFRRMGELRLCLDQDYQAASWSTHIVGPADGEAGAFQPDTAIPLSYDDLKVIEAKRLLALDRHRASPRAPPSPTWSGPHGWSTPRCAPPPSSAGSRSDDRDD